MSPSRDARALLARSSRVPAAHVIYADRERHTSEQQTPGTSNQGAAQPGPLTAASVGASWSAEAGTVRGRRSVPQDGFPENPGDEQDGDRHPGGSAPQTAAALVLVQHGRRPKRRWRIPARGACRPGPTPRLREGALVGGADLGGHVVRPVE